MTERLMPPVPPPAPAPPTPQSTWKDTAIRFGAGAGVILFEMGLLVIPISLIAINASQGNFPETDTVTSLFLRICPI